MNRELKFRAWCDKGKQMHTPCEIYTQQTGELYTRTRYSDDMGSHYNMHGVLMQYTGLKDKNGVEIFEGDIVKWGHISGYYEDPIRIAEVVINPDIQFRLTNNKHTFHFGNFYYGRCTDKALEVIGNIHQTPELL